MGRKNKKHRISNFPQRPQSQPPQNTAVPPQPGLQATLFAQFNTQVVRVPFLPPEFITQYNLVYPELGNKLADSFLRQTDHRIFLESYTVRSDSRRSWGGLIAALTISLSTLAGSIYLIMNGHDAAGSTLIGIDLVGMTSAFMYGTKSRRLERGERLDKMMPQKK